jgi:uncharacterized protein YegL
MSESEGTNVGEEPATHMDTVPVLLLADTSWSMSNETEDDSGEKRAKIEQLNDGLQTFKQEIEGDYTTKQAVEVALVTFGDNVETKQDFIDIQDWQPPQLDASGNTPLCEALIRGAHVVEDHRNALRDENTPLKKALVWLFTDGEATDEDEHLDTAKDVIEKGTEKGEDSGDMLFYLAGVGDEADIDFLDELSSAASVDDRAKVFEIGGKGMFDELFQAVSESATYHSNTGADEAGEGVNQQ